jgi:Domain of unknown function (DUF4129)
VATERSTLKKTAVQSKTAVLGWVLPVVVAVLLVVTTVALAVSHSTELSSSRLDTPDLGMAFGLFVAAATIIGLILWIVILTTEENAKGAPPRRRKGRFASQIALLVIALVVLYLYRRRDHGPVNPTINLPPVPIAQRGGTGLATPVAQPASGGGGFMLLFILGSVVVAGVLAGLILARRARRAALDLDEELAEPDAAADLSAALSAAERASYADDDPRLVIIGCYEALEGVLARRGISRGLADTASAVLVSAERAGLLGPAGAREAEALVEIFERARFSPHDMTGRDVDEARTRLNALREEIATRRLVGEDSDQLSDQAALGAPGAGSPSR